MQTPLLRLGELLLHLKPQVIPWRYRAYKKTAKPILIGRFSDQWHSCFRSIKMGKSGRIASIALAISIPDLFGMVWSVITASILCGLARK